MTQCPNCGLQSPPGTPACPRCGAPLPAGPQPAPYAPAPQAPPPAFVPRVPAAMPAPPPVPILPRQARAFTWMDVCTVLGFTASVVGYFFTSLVLLPLGLVSSLLGFRGDRTRGLAVAGIVLSVIGLLIRLMVVLSDNGLLPDWITAGVW